MLTPKELEALDHLRDLANLMGEIVGDGPPREHDIQEAVWYIHGLQRMIMSQAAARAHPDLLRLLGQRVGQKPDEP